MRPTERPRSPRCSHEGIYDLVRGKLVQGENISQAAQFVQSGNADVGLLALSVALASPMKRAGRYFEIPSARLSANHTGGRDIEVGKR